MEVKANKAKTLLYLFMGSLLLNITAAILFITLLKSYTTLEILSNDTIKNLKADVTLEQQNVIYHTEKNKILKADLEIMRAYKDRVKLRYSYLKETGKERFTKKDIEFILKN